MKRLLLLSIVTLSSSLLLCSEPCDSQTTCSLPDLINEGKRRAKQIKQSLDQQLQTIDPILRTAAGLGALSFSFYFCWNTEKEAIEHTVHHLIEATSSGIQGTILAIPFIASAYLIYHGTMDLLNQPPRTSGDELDEQEEAELVALANGQQPTK